MKRKIIVELETDSEESLHFIKSDLLQEISCCTTSFDLFKMIVFDGIGQFNLYHSNTVTDGERRMEMFLGIPKKDGDEK